jgi:hypothetical protein
MREGHRRAAAAALALAIGLMTVGAGVAGCSGLRPLAAEPQGTVSLAGSWRLDPAHSTDSRRAIADLLAKERRGRRGGYVEAAPGSMGGGPGGAGSRGDPGLGALLATAPEELAPDIGFQKSLLAGGDWLRIEQRPDELVISNGDSSHSYVPGERSVVSVPSGVADQRSGWKGREFWIEIKPQVGPSALEKLRLSPDGRQLIQTIEVGGEGRIPKLEVTRTYVPAAGAPAAVPAGD